MAEMDKDGNGVIDFEEFLELILRQIRHVDVNQHAC